MRIVVLGYIVRGPLGGLAWHHLQYVLGLVRLGHDVRFVEDSDDYPACYDPQRHVVDCDPTYGLRFAADAFGRVGIGNLWCYHDAHQNVWHGPAGATAEDYCRSADMVLNVSGVNPIRAWTAHVPVRVLIDTDPVFTQHRHLTKQDSMKRARDHTAFFTFAENVERGTAKIPDDGLPWRPTRQPVVLDAWPITSPPLLAPYTTVMQWESYRPVEHDGRWYGTKSASFEKFIDLPRHSSATFEIALGGEDAPREMLADKGWRIEDPLTVADTPWNYQKYIRNSRGELSVAKQGYVASNSGWFSERSACYLASGRPVITQETGFSEWMPVGKGLFSFREPDEALAAVAEVEGNYPLQSRQARLLAEENFESGMVLSRLLNEAESLV